MEVYLPIAVYFIGENFSEHTPLSKDYHRERYLCDIVNDRMLIALDPSLNIRMAHWLRPQIFQ